MTVTASERRRALFLGSMGGGLEFYDFVIYASFASQIGKTFFPDEAPAARLLAAFAIFAVGYLVRPLGGILFSHFGDRHGRKAMLRVSIAGMAGATFLIAFMPGYASWGIAATVLLVVLRMVQGLCLGGEIPGAMTLITETMPKRRGLACGFLFMIINVGMLAAQAVQWAITHLMSETAVLSYGWRIGFFIGGLVAIAGFFLRARLSESPAFAAVVAAAMPAGPAPMTARSQICGVVLSWIISLILPPPGRHAGGLPSCRPQPACDRPARSARRRSPSGSRNRSPSCRRCRAARPTRRCRAGCAPPPP